MPLRTSVAVLGLGLYTAAVLPGSPPGLGALLAVAGLAAILGPYAVRGRWSAAYGALALALASSVAVRDAAWVVTLDLAAALVLAVLTRVEAVSWAQVVKAVTGLVPAFGHAPRAVAAPLVERVRGVERGRLAPLLRGAGMATALAVVFGTLFATADQAFAALAGDVLTPGISVATEPLRAVAGLGTVALAGGLLLLRGTPLVLPAPDGGLRRAEWVLPLATLVVVFGAFVAIQVTVLFGGAEHVLGTDGLTYAQYARQGFFQLLAVAALTLAVVAAAVRWVPRSDRGLLRALLGPLCGLTLVVLASAWRRLSLYEDVYGSTRLRVSVAATILWLAVVFLLVVAAGVRMRGSWLPRTTIVSAAAGLLAFTAWNPDARIAERNLARAEPDLGYLATLSADALPVLGCVPGELPETSWAGWNVARARAEQARPCAYR